MNILKKVGLGLGALVIAASAQAEDKIQTEKQPVTSAYVQTTVASDFVAPSGFRMGKGAVNQTYVEGNAGPVKGFVWSNYRLGEEKPNEVDVAANVNFPIAKIKKGPLKGDISGFVGAQVWTYPTPEFGDKPDVLLEAEVKYTGPIDVSVNVRKGMTEGIGKDSSRVYVRGSKLFELLNKESGLKVTLTPEISAAYLDEFFGVTGKAHGTVGATLGVQKGNFNLEAFVKQQFGDNGMETFKYGGISAGWAF